MQDRKDIKDLGNPQYLDNILSQNTEGGTQILSILIS